MPHDFVTFVVLFGAIWCAVRAALELLHWAAIAIRR